MMTPASHTAAADRGNKLLSGFSRQDREEPARTAAEMLYITDDERLPAVAAARHDDKLPGQTTAASMNILTNSLGGVQAEPRRDGNIPSPLPPPLEEGIEVPESFSSCVRFTGTLSLFMKERIAMVQSMIFKTHKHAVAQTAHKRPLCIFLLRYQVWVTGIKEESP